MKKLLIALAVLTTAISSWVSAAELLVLNKSDSTLSFIESSSGKAIATIPTGEGPHEVELSSDGRWAFVSNYGAKVAGNTLSVIDVAARKEHKRVDLGDLRRPHGLSFANDRVYFTAEDSRSIGSYDPKTQRVDWTFATDQGRTHMVVASRAGSTLFTSNMGSNTVGIIEREGNRWKQTLVSVGAGPEGLDVSPDGRELWSAHSGDGRVSIIDVESKKVTHTVDTKTKRSNRVKFTPDGELVLISDLSAGELVVFDARTRSEKARIRMGKSPSGILIPNNEQAYVAVSGEDHIAVVDLETLEIVRTIETGHGPDGMAWRR